MVACAADGLAVVAAAVGHALVLRVARAFQIPVRWSRRGRANAADPADLVVRDDAVGHAIELNAAVEVTERAASGLLLSDGHG